MTDTTNKTPTEILAPDVVSPEVVPAPAPQQGKPNSLWSDAWHELRRKPSFIVSAVLIIFMVVMAAVPTLFTSIDPRRVQPHRFHPATQLGALVRNRPAGL